MEKLGLFWKKTNIVLTRYKANWYSIFLLFVILFGQVVKHFLTFTVYWKGCRQMFINFVSRNISKCYPNKKCNTNSWFHLLSWDVRWHLNSWLWYLLITSLLTFPFHFAKFRGWPWMMPTKTTKIGIQRGKKRIYTRIQHDYLLKTILWFISTVTLLRVLFFRSKHFKGHLLLSSFSQQLSSVMHVWSIQFNQCNIYKFYCQSLWQLNLLMLYTDKIWHLI
jgi:hypothetical protein